MDADVPAIVRIYGQSDSRTGYELRDFLARNVVTYEWIILDSDDDSVRLTGRTLKQIELPVVDLPDGTRLWSPTVNELATSLGWVSPPQQREYDLSIYGAGPAGLSAAVYAASEGLKVVLLEREAVGGQAGYSSLIENYLGFPGGIAGAELAQRAREQALSFGAELLMMRAGIRGEFADDRMHAHLTDGTIMTARSNICATGVEWRRLGVDREDELLGLGIFYGAGTSESLYSEGQDVLVVGGGNSAGQAVINLAAHARTVTMLVRGENLASTLSSYLTERIRNKPNIHVMTSTRVLGLEGDNRLTGVAIQNSVTGQRSLLRSSTMFVCIGGAPNTDWADGTPVERDRLGYLVTGPDLNQAELNSHWPLERAPFYLETSMPGSFAAGDVRHNSIKRVASAVGEGAMAVTFAHRFLAESRP